MDKDTERALHARVSWGSGEHGNGWLLVGNGDIETIVTAEDNFGEPDKGF